jgi:hypothetical protein
VSDSKVLDLLVIEDNLEDEQLVCEALIEIEREADVRQLTRS